jgi:1-acyl-sn-glycerol-3-phosphate acyltransferase
VIFGFILSGQLPTYRHYAPIEAAMLEKYRIFRKLGLFGLDKGPRGAAQFLRTTERIFQEPFGALWITPQGQFVDVRVRPVQLQQGIGALANRLPSGWIVPVALEYPFWDESTPEALIRFGSALPIADMEPLSVAEATATIERAMEANMDQLAVEAQSRDVDLFEDLLRGKAGVGGVYDLWRRAKSWFRGKPANLHHAQPQ